MPSDLRANIKTHNMQAFHTVCTFTVYGFDEAPALFKEIAKECQRYEYLFSHTLNKSSLVRLNNAAGKAVEVEPELAELIQAALAYCEETDGAFDITVGPLVALWNAPAIKQVLRAGQAAHPEGIAEACEHVDWRRVHVEGTTVSLDDPESSIVLGGIAKGYIADKLCEFMVKRGVQHGFVNLGGNVAVFGGKPADEGSTSPFTVGLRKPQPSSAGEEAAFAAVQIENGAVVTSGIYERGLVSHDGSIFHHILDPRTGMPAETDVVSASLICESALEADAYATALVVMGMDRARAFAEQFPACEAVLVSTGGEVHITSGMGTKIPFQLL